MSDTYLTARQVMERYGRSENDGKKVKSTIWLYRRVKNDPSFPRPVYIAGQKYFRLADIEAYDRDPARSLPPVQKSVEAA